MSQEQSTGTLLYVCYLVGLSVTFVFGKVLNLQAGYVSRRVLGPCLLLGIGD